MSVNDWMKICMAYDVDGVKSRVRQRIMWKEIVDKDLRKIHWRRLLNSN